MKRKILTVLLGLVATVSCVLGLVACKDNNVDVPPETVPVTGVTISAPTLTLEEGESKQLTATVSPDNATNKNVSWSSSDEEIATVSNGLVTGVKEGTAQITVTTADGNKTATCAVTVEAKAVEPAITKGFSIKAVDNNGNPVANAYFNIGYYDSSLKNDSYLTSSGTITDDRARAAQLKTNSLGWVGLEIDIESDIKFKLYVADPAYIDSRGTTPAIPKGYIMNFGSNEFGFALTTVDFIKGDNGVYSATAKFKLDNSWGALFDPGNNLVYSRYYPDFYKDQLLEEYSPYVKNAQAGQLNYFTFAPYRAPMPGEDTSPSLTDAVMAKGRIAGSGIYRISWTASDPTAEVLMKLYSFSGGNYFQSNDDGSPTETYVVMHTGNVPTIDEAELQKLYELYKSLYGSDAQNYNTWKTSYLNSFSGTNYITLELSTDTSTNVYSFGYIANKNCNVTITVERIGEAATWTSQGVTMEMPSGATKAENREGRVIDAPLSASTVVFRDENGYYHLGSKDGAIIYVQLTKGTRVNELSMEFLSDANNTDNRPQFVITEDVFNEATNTGVHYYYNYGNVIKGYAALANSDGLYPVNDMLIIVLEHFCKNMLGYNQYGDNYWLAACQYYGEISDGPESKPYDLTEGKNSVTLTDGSAWVAFTPSATGYYEFTYNVPGSIAAKDKYYLSLEAQAEFKFQVTGTGDTLQLEVSSVKSSQHLRYYSSEAEDSQIWHGTEEFPLNVSNLLVYVVTIDHTTYNSALTVSIKFSTSLMNGNYILHVAGSDSYSIRIKAENGYIDYDGSAIALSSTQSTLLHLDSEDNDTYFIWIEKVV